MKKSINNVKKEMNKSIDKKVIVETESINDIELNKTELSVKVSNCEKLNIRTSPFIEDNVAKIVNAGDVFTVEDFDTEWYKIIPDNLYALKKYFTVE